MSTQPENKDSTPVRVRRARVDSIDVYDVKDNELDILEEGSPAELKLNFAIFLLSLAFASFTTLLTATFSNEIYQTTYVVITVVGVLMGGYLLISWWRTRQSMSETVKTIRNRMSKEQEKPSTETPSETKPNKKNDEPVG